jgi:hypothetical protein
MSYGFATKSLPPKPTAVALGLVGLALLIVAGLLARSTYELEQSGIRTEAVVIKLERSGGSYFPVFEFRDVKGREHRVRSNTSSKDYLEGDAIPILYDPDKPLDARVDRPLMLYLLPGILGLIGTLFFFGMFMVYKMLPFFERAYDAQRARHDEANS